LIIKSFARFFQRSNEYNNKEIYHATSMPQQSNDKGQQKNEMTDQLWMQNDTWHSSSEYNTGKK